MPERVRRPHQAVREIVDHKARMDVPIEERQRAVLILHALAQEALRRGWTVTAIPSGFQKDPCIYLSIWGFRRPSSSATPQKPQAPKGLAASIHDCESTLRDRRSASVVPDP